MMLIKCIIYDFQSMLLQDLNESNMEKFEVQPSWIKQKDFMGG